MINNVTLTYHDHHIARMLYALKREISAKRGQQKNNQWQLGPQVVIAVA